MGMFFAIDGRDSERGGGFGNYILVQVSDKRTRGADGQSFWNGKFGSIFISESCTYLFVL